MNLKGTEMNNNNGRKTKPIMWVVLHIMLAILSLGGVFTKKAATEEFLSIKWCLYYGALLFILFIYAIVWQQIIKRLPLIVAYANRAVSVFWGCVFGVIFFGEKITIGKIIGGVLVIMGVILFATADGLETTNPEEGEKND